MKDKDCFSGENAMDTMIRQFADTHGNFISDPETEEGREFMRAVAAQIVTKRNKLDKVGKELAAPHHLEWKRINDLRRKMRLELNAMRDHVMAPVLEYEKAQIAAGAAQVTDPIQTLAAARDAVHERILAALAAHGINNGPHILTLIMDGKIPHVKIDYGQQ